MCEHAKISQLAQKWSGTAPIILTSERCQSLRVSWQCSQKSAHYKVKISR